jgi:DNA-binding MarR family transcriptional regulator
MFDFVIYESRGWEGHMHPAPQGPRESALAALQQATHATLHVLADKLSHLNLGPSEMNLLAALPGDAVRTVGELAAATGTKPSTLTSVLDRLERDGHLERDVDRGDRRRVLITLTPSGRHLSATVRAAMADIEQSALRSVSARDLAGFFAVSAALARAVRSEEGQ